MKHQIPPQRYVAWMLAVSLGLSNMLAVKVMASNAFPNKPITIVAPFSAGGSTDMLARVMAKALSAQFGSPVLVENKAGAGGTIGATYVARATPDGYTLLLSNVTFTSLPVLYKNLGYDFSRDLVGISMLGQVPLILEVNKNLGVKTGREFMDYLRVNDGKLHYGSSGVGAALHVGAQALLNAANLRATHVPYKGTGPMMMDLIAGNVQFALDTAGSASAQIRGGNIFGVAVTSKERDPAWPELPTMYELGVPFDLTIWYSIHAPAQTPPAILQTLHATISRAVNSEDVRTAYAAMGMTPDTRGGEAFAQVIAQDTLRWSKLLRDIGIEPS